MIGLWPLLRETARRWRRKLRRGTTLTPSLRSTPTEAERCTRTYSGIVMTQWRNARCELRQGHADVRHFSSREGDHFIGFWWED